MSQQDLLQLVKDIWEYTTGEDNPWITITQSEAEREGECFAKLHARVAQAVAADKTREDKE